MNSHKKYRDYKLKVGFEFEAMILGGFHGFTINGTLEGLGNDMR